MVTLVTTNPSNAEPWEFRGKSTDTKPTTWTVAGKTQGVPNSSAFFEIDTFNLKMFDRDSQTWIP